MKRLILIYLLFTIHFSVLHAQTWIWASEAVPSGAGFGDVFNANHPIAADAAGNAYITGFFEGTLTFGAYPLSSGNNLGAFMVKYSSAGNVQWAKEDVPFSSACAALGTSVAADYAGNSFLAGNFLDTVSFGALTLMSVPTPLYAQQIGNVFLVKYDVNGNVLWARQAVQKNNISSASLDGVALDKQGNSYVAGGFQDTVSFGAVSLTSQYQDVFLVKYDVNGNVVWARQSTTPSYSSGAAGTVAVDVDGNSYVTGSFGDTVSFGPYMLKDNAQFGEIFLAKYDANGNIVWAKQGISASSASNASGVSVSAGGDGCAYVTGVFQDTIHLGSFTLIAGSPFDNFLAKYDGNGNVIWAKDVNTYGILWSSYSVSADTLKNGGCYFILSTPNPAGPIYSVSFGAATYTLHTNQLSATALIQVDSGGNAVCGTIFTEGAEDDGDGVAVDPTGQYVYITGDIDGETIFGNDTLIYGNDVTFTARWKNCSSCSTFVTACCNTTLNSGSSTTLNATPASTYSWTPAAGLSCTNCQSPVATPTVTTMYYVTVTDSGGCTATDSVLITVDVPVICGSLFVPDAFSPNNDGQNDMLYVHDNCIATMDLTIFDRWGNKVFESQNVNNGWDGTYKGEPMPIGTYMYYFSAVLNDGTSLSKKGSVALVR